MKLSKIYIDQNLVPSSSPAPFPVKCPNCDGNGWTEEIKYGSTHGCCGVANRDGSCCGNAIEVPTMESIQEPCPCGGHDKAVEQWHRGRLNFCEEDQDRVLFIIAEQQEGPIVNVVPEPNTLIPVELEAEIVETVHSGVCDTCWGDAYLLSRSNGKDQHDNYRDLLEKRKDNPCKIEVLRLVDKKA